MRPGTLQRAGNALRGVSVPSALLLTLVATVAWSADPAEPTPVANTALQFRRVYVPADRIKELAGGALPLKLEEFERLLRQMETAAKGRSAGAAILRAEYSARLEQNQLVGGEAKLDVALQGEEAVLIPFESSRLAVANPIWDEIPPRPATLALAADGKPVLLVDKGGRLKFPFTLRGAENVLGGVEFDLSLPLSPSNRLTLQLPKGLAPVVDHGLVIPLSATASTEEQPAALRTWSIELGGNTQVALRIVPEQSLAKQQQLVLLRESLNYSLTPNGLNLAADLRLDVHHEPLRRLVLRIDPGLHLASARYGDKSLPVVVTPSTSGPSQVVIELPEPIAGSDRQIQLLAVGPIVLREKWKLPAIRVEGPIWQEGSASLAVPEPLLLQDITPKYCRQSKVGPLHAPIAGEFLQFQSFSAERSLEVQLGRRASRLKLLSGTTITFGTATVTGVTKADVTALQGEQFDLACDVTRLWVIDAVETEPADLLDDWGITVINARTQQVQLRLKKAVDARQPARIIVRAHRQPSIRGTPLTVEQLRLAEFQNIPDGKHLVLARAEPPHRLEASGDADLLRVDPSKLSQAETALLEPDAGGLLFEDGPGSAGLRVSLENERARFTAEALVDAILDGETLTEEYRVRCRPESSRVSRLLVHMSHAREAELIWTLRGQDERAVTPRRISEEEQRDLGLAGGETWELAFPRPQLEPFEARAQRTTSLPGKRHISLISLPEAESQTGELSISAADGTRPLIENQTLHAIPFHRAAADRYSNVRAVYRYEPAQGDQLAITPDGSRGVQSLAFAWSCELTSRYSAAQASHTARYLVENLGRGQLVFTLPPETSLEQIFINESEVPPPALSSANRQCAVALPAGIRYPAVTLTYTSAGIPAARLTASGLSPVIPKTDFPVLERRWHLWLPQEFEVRREPDASLIADSPSDWGRRLLGPLYRGGAARFDPLRRSAWRELISGRMPEQAATATQTRCVEALGNLALAVPAGSDLMWGDLLTRYERLLEQEETRQLPSLLVDRQSLANCGVTPRTAVYLMSQRSSDETGAAMLAAANLRIAESPEGMVLTSSLTHSTRARLAEGEQISIASWAASADLPPSPWPPDVPAPHAALATAGWTTQSFEIPDSGQITVQVHRPRTALALAWGVFFVAAFFAWGIAANRPRWLILAVVGAGLVALLLDHDVASLGTASFLGVLLGGLLVVAWRARGERILSIEDVSTRTGVHPLGLPAPLMWPILLALVITLSFAARGWAADPPSAQAKEAAPQLFPVYIPIDEKRQPTQGLVYLPREFYDAIERAAAAGSPARDWLVQTALYQCQLERAAIGGKLSVAEFTARFDLETGQAKTRVALPLKRAGVHLFGERARLDGQPVQVDWSEDEQSVMFDVEKPGKHVLELALQPTVHADGALAGFDVGIPRLPRARLKYSVPLGVEGVTCPKALGATDTDVETRELTVELGPVNNLSLRWPPLGGVVGRSADLDAEQLLWLKVRPGSVVVEGRFKFSQVEGQLREVRIVCDPRWRLLPPRADQPIARYKIDEGDLRTLHFELKPPYTNEAVLNLSFLLSGASGVGNLVLPRLEAVCERSSRRWLGVTLDPELEGVLPAVTPDTAAAPADFLKAWGKGVGPLPLIEPQAAYRLSRGEAAWSVAARPKQPQTSGTAQFDLTYGGDAAAWQFEADLTTTGGSLFQHKFLSPPGIDIESMSIRQGATERSARWSPAGNGQSTVFLASPVTGEHRLIVRGKLDRPPRGDWEIPRLSIADVKVETSRIRVYHRPESRVRVAAAPGFALDQTADLGMYREDFGRLGAVLIASPAKPGSEESARPVPPVATVVVEANAPQTQCRLITAMLRKAGVWTAEVECRLSIDSGTLDAVRFDVPAEWSGPYEIEPPADVKVSDVPGQSRKRLLVRPAAPLTGDCVLRVRGTLSPAPKGRVAAPDISLLDIDKVERYLVVPTQVESQQIGWETSGLQATPLPLETRARFPVTESFAAFQVIGSSYQAAIKHVERVSGVPQVRLADIHLAWRADGSCHGVALFDLEPAGLRHCLLEIPSHLELVHAEVAELPALLSPEGNTIWRIELGPDQLPQRIAVAFQGGVPHEESPPARLRFAAPALKNIPVERTLWTIHSSDRYLVGRMVVAGQTDDLRQEVIRFQTTAALIERAADLVSESSPREVADWYAPWAERLAASRRTIDVLRLNGKALGFDVAELAGVERQQAALAARLRSGAPAGSAEKPAAGRRQLFQSSEPAADVVHCEFTRGQFALDVTCVRSTASDLPARLTAAAGLLLAALLVYFLAARGIVGECLYRWPHTCGAVLGIGWWLFLAPSVLGLVVVAVSVLGAFRFPWKAPRSRPDPITARTASPRPVAR